MTEQANQDADALRPALAQDGVFVIVGLGGVGQIVALYLSKFLSSLRIPLRVFLIDGDEFEPGNISRMFFAGVGNKALVTKKDLLSRIGESQLTIMAVEEFITPDNIGQLIRPGSTVLLCCDNHATRKLISDFAGQLDDITLVSGGNDGYGMDASGTMRQGVAGNVQVYIRRDGADVSPDLTKYHPEIANPQDKRPDELSCTELMASTPQLLFANLMTASCMLNAWWLSACNTLGYSELFFDIKKGRMAPVAIPAPQFHRCEARNRILSSATGSQPTGSEHSSRTG